MDDTPPDIRRRLVDGWRAMSPLKKAALVDAWSSDCRALAVAGLRERHPLAAHDELQLRLGSLLLGAATARQALGGTGSGTRRTEP